MPLQWTTTRVAAATNGVKILVHGFAGVGKTPLCGTAPKPVILAAEAGLMTLRHLDIPVIQIRSIADLDEAYQFFAYDKTAPDYCRTICLDSVTELAEVCLAHEKTKSKDPRKAYGEMQDQMMNRLRWYRDLPYHVYFSAKCGTVVDQATGLTRYGPMMPGQKLGPQVPYLFDEIFSLEVATDQEGNRYNYLRTAPHPQYEARDRSMTLDPIEEPNLTKIINKIMAGTTTTGATA